MNKQAVLEGLLYVTGSDGITLKKIEEILEISEEEALSLIEILKEEYKRDNHGIELIYLGNSYKLSTKAIHKEFYRSLLEEESNVLSQSALETLAIIAYNEPVTRSLVSEIRGVDSSHMVKKLLIKNLVEEAGRAELPGRPMLYKTTNKFLDYFGLKSKEDLPKIEQIEEIDKETDLFSSKYSEIL